jgi:hypothetical protein
MFRFTLLQAALVAGTILAVAAPGARQAARADDPINNTWGVHNDWQKDTCANPGCTYLPRPPGVPSDPSYPAYWTSHWTMYRVFNKFQQYPPPYDGKPPASLTAGRDYEVSQGVTYYDTEWHDTTRNGAMEEHYVDRCLPIFPIDNHFTCSFISLGKTAFFVTYDKDRPANMPPVCLFSPDNSPPAPDFISHLPYSIGDSSRLDYTVQGYSFWVAMGSNKPFQTGVFPDQTDNGGIMFGYAFNSKSTPDRVRHDVAPYRHPQSFYFSGYPFAPANAPVVSQNYTDFAMIRPTAAETWAQVSNLDPSKLPPCHLFQPLPSGGAAPTAAAGAHAPVHTWGSAGGR